MTLAPGVSRGVAPRGVAPPGVGREQRLARIEADMHPQLRAIADEFTGASRRLHRLAASVPAERWRQRAHPARWSIAECIAHLNLTSDNYRPLVERALAAGRERGGPAPARYRRDLMGWLLWRTAGPPVRFRVKTTAPFIPESTLPKAELVESFDRLQEEQLSWVAAADGLRLGELRITSPFDARFRYNLYACLAILPRHQHRHLWQAEAVWRALQAQQPPCQSDSSSSNDMSSSKSQASGDA